MKFGPFFFMLLRVFVNFVQKVIEQYGDDDDKKDLEKNGFGSIHPPAK